MKAKVREKGEVPGIVALLAIIIVLYSLWGASLIRAQQHALSQTSANSLATVQQ